MRTKQWLILILTFTVLVGCSVQAAPLTPANPVDSCPAATADLQLLTNTEDGYCLLYPAAYSVNPPHLIVINPVEAAGDVPGDAWATIYKEAAAGRTAEQVADAEIAAAGAGFNITKGNVTVDGQQAVVVDGLPGPDPWRKLFIVSNEQLYTLTFQPWVPSTDAAGQATPLEGLYQTIVDTLHFLPPQ